MSTKYYRDSSGNYIGAYEGATPPSGAIEVSRPPKDASYTWDGADWVASVTDYAEKKKQEISDSLNDVLAAGFKCSNGITMDAFDYDAAKLDRGYRLTERLGGTTMNIRDHFDKRHPGKPLSEVYTMVSEMGANYQMKLDDKWLLQEEIDAVVARNQLDPTDPDYLDGTAARAAIDAVALVQ